MATISLPVIVLDMHIFIMDSNHTDCVQNLRIISTVHCYVIWSV